MLRTILLVVLLTFCPATHGLVGAQETFSTTSSAGSLESKTDLQLLHITVTRGDQRIRGLRRDDFSILDNQVRQELITFDSGEVPISVVLLLDYSKSIGEEKIDQFKKAAYAFLNGLKPSDEAALIAFSDRALMVTPFTNEKGVLLKALQESTPPGTGTSVNDHLYAALNLLHDRGGRRVVLLVSDGVDIESMLSMEDVLWKVRRSQALIYWILPQDEAGPWRNWRVVSISSSWRDRIAHRQEMTKLEQAVKLSGGRIEVVKQIERLENAFEDVLSELREQYTLGYLPNPRTRAGQWRSVKVRVGVRGAKVRARSGYFDE